MHYVYILKSLAFEDKKYIGVTIDREERLKKHNKGEVRHTSKFKPWKIVFYAAFEDKIKACAFEKYLKSHSGRAFASKRLL